MTDINYLDSISLGKINRYEMKKASTLMPISFPGQNESNVYSPDTLGVIAYIEISGVLTGKQYDLQNTLNSLHTICDGNQITPSVFYSPFLNVQSGISPSTTTLTGIISTTTSSTAYRLIDTNVTFIGAGIQIGDRVKNLLTEQVAQVTSSPAATQLVLGDFDGSGGNIFGSAGIPYAITTHCNVKILEFKYRWELPGLNYVYYDLSLVVSN